MSKQILVTGAFGFIGSHFTRLAMNQGYEVDTIDNLTYAGDVRRLGGCWFSVRNLYTENICELGSNKLPNLPQYDYVVHFAAETHVDRSIRGAARFLETNVLGTQSVIDMCLAQKVGRLLVVSTDEVYGEVLEGERTELDRTDPRNPYSASKLAAESLALAAYNTYGLDVVVTRGCNTYGIYQHPEKFIPRAITSVLREQPIPLYTPGTQIREWITLEDHCSGIMTALTKGDPGEVYNVGSGVRCNNLHIVREILTILEKPTNPIPESLLEFVPDRPGHDKRYAIDSNKLKNLGWIPTSPFHDSLAEVVRWYCSDEGKAYWKNRAR